MVAQFKFLSSYEARLKERNRSPAGCPTKTLAPLQSRTRSKAHQFFESAGMLGQCASSKEPSGSRASSPASPTQGPTWFPRAGGKINRNKARAAQHNTWQPDDSTSNQVQVWLQTRQSTREHAREIEAVAVTFSNSATSVRTLLEWKVLRELTLLAKPPIGWYKYYAVKPWSLEESSNYSCGHFFRVHFFYT